MQRIARHIIVKWNANDKGNGKNMSFVNVYDLG
jgi:hypothetical protein